MSEKLFPSAQDAETAFYEALERADLEAMMAVWSEEEEIVCVHPAGQRLVGHEQVREGWRQIFAGGANMRVQITHKVVASGVMVAVHSLHEQITVAGEASARPPIVASNVYLRTPAGWRMLLHHASAAPAAAERNVPAADPSRQTLH